MSLQRLDKVLAGQGVGSRKEVKALIAKGQVSVNAEVVRQADYKVETQSDRLLVGGREIAIKEHLYLMLHKPMGVVSATEDKKQKTVLDLVPAKLWRKGLFPAGRLDRDTEGFVLLTDDGGFAHRILSPRNHLPKVYLATLDHPLEEGIVQEFQMGVRLNEEDRCSPAILKLLENGENPRVEVTIHEGMYHQIKRMFLRFGYRVLYLKRLKIGGLELDPSLPMGACRELENEELSQITRGYLDEPGQ